MINIEKDKCNCGGLLFLSLLTGCTAYKIERNQQDIEQEKVEK